MNCILYARFSPRPDAKESESNATQLDFCRAFATKNGWPVAGTFEDVALSGDDLDRPGLWAAMDALEKGDVLLVYKLDRLARSAYLSFDLERQAAQVGARIVSVMGEGTASNSPEDELMRRILQALAQYQKRVMAARTKAAMLRHQQTGRRMSRTDRCPIGWRPSPSDPKRMEECPVEQAALSRARELQAKGESLRSIAASLGSFRGGAWHHQSLARVLRKEN